MKIRRLIWIDDIIQKLSVKHQVNTTEVREVVENTFVFRFAEKGHVADEHMYGAYGQTEAGRYLIVFFIYKKDASALIISARDMTRQERKLYEKS